MKQKTNSVRLGARLVLTRAITPPLLAGIGLLALFPATGEAAGTTVLTKTIKYYPTGAQTVLSVDPEDVESFQLHFQFDAAEVGMMGLDLRTPFAGLAVAIDGNMIQVSGSTALLHDGDVDIFRVIFNALPPGVAAGKPLDQIKFTAFATGNDFIITNNLGVKTRYSAAEINAASGAATPGVAQLNWDANGIFNDGILGGTGTWDTAGTRFDSMPRGIAGEPLADVAWSNATNSHDIAAFGGNGGTVTVATISAGGLQFDASGYTLQGGTLTLSRPIAVPQTVPTIDTASNSATINTALAGTMGFEKLGTGTLTLGGANTYTGTTTIKAGTLTVDRTVGGSLSTSTPLTLAGNARFHYRTFDAGPGQTLGPLTFAAGDGSVQILNTLAEAKVR